VLDEVRRRAAQFRSWHASASPAILPCAWDVASAKVFEAEGFEAIGTTSAGVAASLGYADGQKISFQEHLQSIRRIVQSVQVPLSVDLEGGYSTTVEGVAANVRQVLEAGVVAINVEDENHARSGVSVLEPRDHMVRKIKAIREVAREFSVDLFLNAKSDAVWLSAGSSEEESLQEAIERANTYGDAGADCVFIPGNLDENVITRMVRSIRHPLNIVIKEKTPSVATLRKLGVKRLSMGSGPMRAALGVTRAIAREIRASGTYESCSRMQIPYYEIKALFEN